jgi:thiamine-monophosphate kinase
VNENKVLQRIEKAFATGRKGKLGLGIGDDAALFTPVVGHELLLSCDWFLEGTHFLKARHPADAVGWKCLARAVSDLAAMGGIPRCFLLSLALPESATGRWLHGFLGGLRRASKQLDCELAGGDTTRRDEILINVTVVGEVRKGQAIRRAGTRPGDVLYVTGNLGEAELGLQQLKRGTGMAGAGNSALRKHLYPEPRLAVGQWLAEKRLTSAMIDLSDGLSTDLARLCAASRVGARIHVEDLPVSSLAAGMDRVRLALHGGDDYELLLAVRKKKAVKIPARLRGVKLTRIGEITAGKKILVNEAGEWRDLVRGGWDPFRKTTR